MSCIVEVWEATKTMSISMERQLRGPVMTEAMKVLVSPFSSNIALTSTLGKYLELWTICTKLDDGIDETLSKRIWRTRHIGLLFSKQGTFPILLVLIAPLSTDV